ncbi:MAG: tetratricopeptide repeat protein [Woeseia sp.]
MAGLRTQAALAERIADLEGLEAAPRDIVNRVFREQPVDSQTIERVARALGVEAYTLYKTTREASRPVAADAHDARVPGAYSSRQTRVATAAALVAVLAMLGWWLTRDPPAVPEVTTAQSAPQPLGLGASTLAVLPIRGDTDAAVTAALRKALGDVFTVATATSTVLLHGLDPLAAAERLRTDAVLDGEIVTVGRLGAVRLYLFSAGVRRQVWGESLPVAALANEADAIAMRTALAVQQVTGMPVPENSVGHFPLAPVQDDYLQGEYYLERPSNELNVRRAQGYFEAALRQDANYARAHAGLCQTLLEAHWMDDEERALQDAARACGHALQLDPDDRVVTAAHAHFLRRTGRNDEAIALYEKIIAAYPADAAARAGLASSLLQAFRQSGDSDALQSAKAAARQAADLDPLVWKPLFALATMEWFDGDVTAAIEAGEETLARDENEFVLANLGTFYLCDGAFDAARATYQRARELNPQSYVGDEFLGMAHYFLGDFARSAELRRRAIESVASGAPEIHEMWGNLGDSYRQTGNSTHAVDAYLRAAEIAERDFLRGTAPAADRAARAYYYTMLSKLAPDSVPDDVMRTIDDEIDSIAADLESATALRRMAQTYLERGEAGKARASLKRATATCRGYARLPDLAALDVSRGRTAGAQ